ncbi:[FeFe] hydrogenase H-cluster radical SAM maturase HydE [Thermovenabulum gondwanense]|uniref:Biotin synthase n=1 Tax=Thermovenabulum gondwanense TaxID=520767 RepID=A0A162M9P7_9FIRM|nr:[FeFe] hydrogenase H-cluster radical SAM maturase HydE [Thermovenabulum gondwanense]KYO64607.1 Biotin synthase [Thermovenabulum gondwanense]
MLNEIWEKIDSEVELNKQELCYILSLEDPEKLEILYQKADKIRKKYVGDEVHLRGLIEFSNYCRNNCLYCGIRRDNKKVRRYRMEIDEIFETVSLASRLGYKTVVLQSGEDMYYTLDKLTELIKRIKNDMDIAITLSIGERSYEEYEKLYEAGADRYLMRFETSNPELYAKLHPDSSFENRINILKWLKQIGYQTGSGVMIGLPGQTIEDLAEDILMFKKLDLDMIGVGPYICHPDTPLAGNPGGTAEMTLKVIALTRIVTKNTHIPATTALATLRPEDGREKALMAGANVIMPNVTPLKYREHYTLYPNKICINESALQCNSCIKRRIYSIGRVIGTDYGHSLKKRENG